jgi:hypothetical protein
MLSLLQEKNKVEISQLYYSTFTNLQSIKKLNSVKFSQTKTYWELLIVVNKL